MNPARINERAGDKTSYRLSQCIMSVNNVNAYNPATTNDER